MRRMMGPACAGFAALFLVASAAPTAHAGAMTYVALGDSIAYGETTPAAMTPTYATNQGYVGSYSDSLAAQNGGVAPNVVNLGIAGETSSSFFSGGMAAAPMNMNYGGVTTSQNSALIDTLQAQQAAGNTVSNVTVSLGANDLYSIVGQPGFFQMSPMQQQGAILQGMIGVQNNYNALLTEIHSLAPDAQVSLVGYYNPYAATPGSPLAGVAGPAIQLLNAIIAGEAQAYGAKYVDVYNAFLGKEGSLTHILDDPAGLNPHPNADGYAVIAALLTPVPEPTTLAMMGVLGIGLFARHRHRRSVAA